MATTIVLVRHGETDWNRERRFQGHADVPLNEDGRTQVAALADEFADERFAAAYTSPLRRAAESAEILATRLALVVQPSDALGEVDVGSWSGLTIREIEDRFPDGFRRWRLEGRGLGGRRSVRGLQPESGRRTARDCGSASRRARTRGDSRRADPHGARCRGRFLAGEFRGPGLILENCAVVRIAVRDGVMQTVD